MTIVEVFQKHPGQPFKLKKNNFWCSQYEDNNYQFSKGDIKSNEWEVQPKEYSFINALRILDGKRWLFMRRVAWENDTSVIQVISHNENLVYSNGVNYSCNLEDCFAHDWIIIDTGILNDENRDFF